jgi:hypothetical protein
MVKAIGRRPPRYGWAAACLGILCTGALLVVLVRIKNSDHDTPAAAPPAASGSGRTIFVSATAVPAGAEGTAGRPFVTIQQAVDLARPGDTVRVGPGSYAGFHTVRSGTSGRPIRLSGVDAEIARVGGDDSSRLIELTDDYLELAGFEVVGGTAGIRLYGAHHVSIVHNVVRDALGECVRVKNQSTNNVVAFNEIRSCGRRNFNLAEDRKNGEGIYIGTAPEQLDELPGDGPDRSDDNWVHDNKIDTPAECVDVKEFSSAVLVEHNMCTGGQDPDSAGFSARGDRLTFRGNTVYGGAGAGIRLGGDKAGQGIDTVVVDNDFEHPRGYGVKIMRTPQGRICGNGLLDPGEGASNIATADPATACP